MKEPKVCVIMPVYNGEKTIKLALASLLNQSYTNWECVIVNDGSMDGTRSILDSLKDPRFRIFHLNKNCGRGVARDEALKRSEGDYLAYLDADDMMYKDKLKVQVEFLEANPGIRMVSCGCITMNENFEALRASGMTSFMSDNIMKYGQALPLLLGATMVRLDQAKIFSYNHYLDVGEDYDYFARYCEGYHYANIGKPYYYYLTGNVTAKKLMYYQTNALRTDLVIWQRGRRLKAITNIFKRCTKILLYSILIPIIGVDRIVNKRGNKIEVSTAEQEVFKKELNTIKSISSTI